MKTKPKTIPWLLALGICFGCVGVASLASHDSPTNLPPVRAVTAQVEHGYTPIAMSDIQRQIQALDAKLTRVDENMTWMRNKVEAVPAAETRPYTGEIAPPPLSKQEYGNDLITATMTCFGCHSTTSGPTRGKNVILFTVDRRMRRPTAAEAEVWIRLIQSGAMPKNQTLTTNQSTELVKHIREMTLPQ